MNKPYIFVWLHIGVYSIRQENMNFFYLHDAKTSFLTLFYKLPCTFPIAITTRLVRHYYYSTKAWCKGEWPHFVPHLPTKYLYIHIHHDYMQGKKFPKTNFMVFDYSCTKNKAQQQKKDSYHRFHVVRRSFAIDVVPKMIA